MSLDLSRCRLKPFQHQKEDVEWLLSRPFAFVCSEMRTGKSACVIWAMQFLFEHGTIENVIIVAPAPVRDVWADEELGELAKHLWLDTPAVVVEFHTNGREWIWGRPQANGKVLRIVVTNFEFLNSKNRQRQLKAFCGPKTLLVLDESSYVKNWKAERTKACLQLRRQCGRVILLNGTPIFHSPLDLFSQGNILHPGILACPYVTHFRSRYAIMEPVLSFDGKALKDSRGNVIEKLGKWVNLDDLQHRFAPYTIRRLQKDCLDLPPKLDPVTITATLDPETWNHYKSMRDDLVVWLQSGVATSATAAIKVLRLSQITGGFVSGIEAENIDDGSEGLLESMILPGLTPVPMTPRPEQQREDAASMAFVGREKLDVLLWFLQQRLDSDPMFKVVVWCRFKPELARMLKEVGEKFPQFIIGAVHGGQKKTERLEALRLLHPDTSPKSPVFVGGTFGTGSFGLNMTAAHTSVTMSTDYSPGKFAQSADRVYGPGQTEPIAYFDIVATGPKGQKTIDHTIVAARRAGEDIASWTAAAWVKAIRKE